MSKPFTPDFLNSIHTDHEIASLAFSPNGKQIAVASIHSKEVQIYDVQSQLQIAGFEVEKPAQRKNLLIWTQHGFILYVHGEGGNQVGLWSDKTFECQQNHNCAITGGIKSVAVSDDGYKIGLATSGIYQTSSQVWWLDLQDGQLHESTYPISANHVCWMQEFMLVSGHIKNKDAHTGILLLTPGKKIPDRFILISKAYETHPETVVHPDGQSCLFTSIGAQSSGAIFTTIWSIRRGVSGISTVGSYFIHQAADVVALLDDERFLIESLDGTNAPLKIITPESGFYETLNVGAPMTSKAFSMTKDMRYLAIGVGHTVLLCDLLHES